MINTETLKALPRYQSHKVVKAGKIADFTAHHTADDPEMMNRVMLAVPGQTPGDEMILEMQMPYSWIEKHDPQIGGYLVVYDDDYVSYSPAEPFEAGNSLINTSE